MAASSSKAVQASVIFMGIFSFLLFLWVGQSILVPLTCGVLGAMILYPLVLRLERRLSPTAAILAAMFLAGLLFLFIAGLISVQFASFARDLPQIAETTQDKLSGIIYEVEQSLGLDPEGATDLLREGSGKMLGVMQRAATTIMLSATDFFSSAVLILIYIFFFLLYRHSFVEFLYKIAPQRLHEDVAEALPRIQGVIRNYVEGLALVILVVAVLNVTGLWLVGVQYPVFFGVFAALLTVIPYFGILIGALPPLVMSLAMDSFWYPAGVLLVFVVVQFLEGNFITPRIVGNKVSINPLAAMVALMAGGLIWGIWGLILFVPLVAIFRVVLDIFDNLKPVADLLGNIEKPEKKPVADVFRELKDQTLGAFSRRRQPGDQDPDRKV